MIEKHFYSYTDTCNSLQTGFICINIIKLLAVLGNAKLGFVTEFIHKYRNYNSKVEHICGIVIF